jgi:hypothetical protein
MKFKVGSTIKRVGSSSPTSIYKVISIQKENCGNLTYTTKSIDNIYGDTYTQYTDFIDSLYEFSGLAELLKNL